MEMLEALRNDVLVLALKRRLDVSSAPVSSQPPAGADRQGERRLQ
jgi:hypothetical protein